VKTKIDIYFIGFCGEIRLDPRRSLQELGALRRRGRDETAFVPRRPHEVSIQPRDVLISTGFTTVCSVRPQQTTLWPKANNACPHSSIDYHLSRRLCVPAAHIIIGTPLDIASTGTGKKILYHTQNKHAAANPRHNTLSHIMSFIPPTHSPAHGPLTWVVNNTNTPYIDTCIVVIIIMLLRSRVKKRARFELSLY